jgi:ethanolamine permease
MPESVGAVEYDQVTQDYLTQRELKRGAAGWVLLASLGVSYVISGDFAGWNFGLGHGGFGGMLIAVIAMAVMYLFLVFTLAELSTSLPTAGGGYSFARRAMGPWGGYLTGTAILLEYALAPAAIVIFIGPARLECRTTGRRWLARCNRSTATIRGWQHSSMWSGYRD